MVCFKPTLVTYTLHFTYTNPPHLCLGRDREVREAKRAQARAEREARSVAATIPLQDQTYTVPISDQPLGDGNGGDARTFSLGNLGTGVAGADDGADKSFKSQSLGRTHQRRPLGRAGGTSENLVAAIEDTCNRELLSCSLEGFRHRASAAFRWV